MIPRSNSTLYLPMFTYLLFFSLFSESDGKVSLELYYESLCPESANVVTNYLSEVFNTDLNSIVNVKLFPWGNTKLHPWLPDEPVTNASYYCQHGEFECFLDTVEACVIDIWPEPIERYRSVTIDTNDNHKWVVAEFWVKLRN
ncbi:hypothetical protein RJT34_12514 [Clitoria ternatea]|uniref:Gamma interferon inducible lysosomal thiol reductase GILT n=1 Tax=Clitoria ternatea TaxID=43366 RepID=A0AAN9JQG2_CLITE